MSRSGGMICAVAICTSRSKIIKEKGGNVRFFTFPKQPEICEEWVRKCYRTDKFSSQNARICSLHFQAEDFEDELRATLMGYAPKRLKKDAIPSLFLLPDNDTLYTVQANSPGNTLTKREEPFSSDLDDDV
ncbi:THAP domain-containing protein 2-like [Euwallacea similis]|uniref:THAP domain-containing protein 2-like n=1 Tax=Euwallacea similis TaxID=1736056 RepID=UPI00344F2EC3